jgi:Lrp/AsnC family transcriptional regulator, regulator for asnA, asnC and gidA
LLPEAPQKKASKKVINLNERLKIDETDAKILRQLLKESRTSFTDLSKICNITVGAVRMRYKKLWRIGVINGEIMQVNPQSLGYKYVCDLSILSSVEDEKKVMEFLATRPYIQNTLRIYGKYNLTSKTALTDMQELAAILADLEANPSIKQIETSIWADLINTAHPENLMINQQIGEKKSFSTNPSASKQSVEIDEIDRKIAKILSQHSRTTFRKIAEQTGISTKNVIQRYRRLRGNVLTLSSITVNLKKLGYNAYAFAFIKVANKGKLQEVHNQLLGMPNLIISVRLIGSYDLGVIMTLHEFQELFKFKEDLRKIQNIAETEIFLNPPMQMYPMNLFNNLL